MTTAAAANAARSVHTAEPRSAVATAARPATARPVPRQAVFDDLGTPLAQVSFVVVDLETTGGSPADCEITEIGAVRVRGGAIQGELQTLVNPGVDIPPFIAALTGITTAAVADAPRLGAVLPSFLEFARESVLVAHNAGFDVGFLKAACRRFEHPWPSFPVVDTARLARVLLHRDEVRNHRLATLARFFRAGTTPTHRALADARATVDVLHGLLERAAGFGVHHLQDLMDLSGRVRPEQRAKRTLADGLPDRPGVYVFLGPRGESLYVGKARSIRSRVRSYFTNSEQRARILEMVRIAERVQAIPCATELEAQVREVRLISERQPPYNRRSRNASRPAWLKLGVDPVPRLTVVTRLGADRQRGATYVGPFTSHRGADQAREAVQAAHQLRTCTDRLTSKGGGSGCIRAEIGSCVAPCRESAAVPDYLEIVAAARRSLAMDQSAVVSALHESMRTLSAGERFEEAAAARDRLQVFLRATALMADLTLLGETPLLVAAEAEGRDWAIHVIRHGRLAASARASPQSDPRAVVAAAVATAEQVPCPADSLTAATAEESQLIMAWLWRPTVRLVRLDGQLALPVNPARRLAGALAAARAVRLPGSEPPVRGTVTPVPARSRISPLASARG